MSETISNDHVPQAVKDALAKRYPDARPEAWTYTAEYEADLSVNGQEVEITFDQHGDILQIETEITPDALPEAVTTRLAQDFPSATIEEVEIVEIPDAELTFFEVELDENGDSIELHIHEDGRIIDVDDDL